MAPGGAEGKTVKPRPAPAPAPAHTITGKGTAAWVLRNGPEDNATERELDEPAATIYSSRSGNLSWKLRNGNQNNACERRACEPAGTLFFGVRTNAIDWVMPRMHPAGTKGSYEYSRPVDKPSPTIKGGGSGGQYVVDQETTRRVTVQEAAILQSFRPDYPWQGTKSQQYQQVGNAVPPLLGKAVLHPLIDPTPG
jgi:DNA (cytosine-5)-methyltransferase 1